MLMTSTDKGKIEAAKAGIEAKWAEKHGDSDVVKVSGHYCCDSIIADRKVTR